MILSCAAGCTGSISYTDETKSVLQDLDKVIGERARIDRDKAIRIGEIKASLDGNPSPAERYEIYDRLYDEYYQYDIDSAITYARKKLSIALKTGGRNHDGLTSWTVGDAELDIADRYVLSGMNIEALDIIRKIDADSLPYDLRPRWYHICNSLYGNLYSSSDDPILRAGYLRERRRYRESLLELLGDEDISKVYVWSECEIDKGTGQWFAGGVTDEQKRVLNVPMTFLDAGKTYIAKIYADAPDADYETNPQAYLITELEVTSDTVLPVTMARGGGFAISFTEKDK